MCGDLFAVFSLGGGAPGRELSKGNQEGALDVEIAMSLVVGAPKLDGGRSGNTVQAGGHGSETSSKRVCGKKGSALESVVRFVVGQTFDNEFERLD